MFRQIYKEMYMNNKVCESTSYDIILKSLKFFNARMMTSIPVVLTIGPIH